MTARVGKHMSRQIFQETMSSRIVISTSSKSPARSIDDQRFGRHLLIVPALLERPRHRRLSLRNQDYNIFLTLSRMADSKCAFRVE